MENPQTENGFTKVANEILESLTQRHLSSYEWRCLWFILRKTYGYNKKEDWLSLSQFVEGTQISRPHVCRSLMMLRKQNIITKGGTKKKPLYSFQKYSINWTLLPKGARSHHVTKGGNEVVPKGAIQVVPKGAHTKDNITKDNIQKKEYSSLKDIQEVDLQEIADQYQVPLSFVKSKYEDLILYCSSKGKKYRNYKLALMAWVKKDAMTIIKEQHDRSKIVYIP